MFWVDIGQEEKVKCCTLQLKLRQRIIAQLKEELGVVEYKEQVCICEPEKGSSLGECDDGPDRRLVQILTDHLENEDQRGKLIPKASNEAIKPYVLNTNESCE